jgi:hypothetical protein
LKLRNAPAEGCDDFGDRFDIRFVFSVTETRPARFAFLVFPRERFLYVSIWSICCSHIGGAATALRRRPSFPDKREKRRPDRPPL